MLRWAQNHAEDVKDWAKDASISLLLRQEEIGEKPRERDIPICCPPGLVEVEVYESRTS